MTKNQKFLPELVHHAPNCNIRKIRDDQNREISESTLVHSDYDINRFIQRYVKKLVEEKKKRRLYTKVGNSIWKEAGGVDLSKSNVHIQFMRLRGENFFSYSSFDMNLDHRGLVYIHGYDERGRDSNGAGKSALFVESLFFCLFDQTLRGIHGKDVTRFGEQSCYVELTLLVSGEEHRIARHRDGKRSWMVIDGVEYGKKEGEYQLHSFLPLTPFLMKYAVVFIAEFDYCSTLGITEQRELLDEVLGFKGFDDALKVSRKMAVSYERKYYELDGKIQSKKELSIYILKTLQDMKRDSRRERRKRNKSIRKLKLLRKKYSRVSLRRRVCEGKTHRFKDDDGRFIHSQELLKRELYEKSQLESVVQTLSRELTTKVCSRCKQIIRGDVREQYRKDVEEEKHHVQREVETTDKAIIKLQDDIKSCEGAHKKYIYLLKKLDNYTFSLKKIESRINYYCGVLSLKVSSKDTLARMRLKLKKVRGVTKKLVVFQTKVKRIMEVYSFWVNGFNSQGIQQLIANHFASEMTSRMASYLEILGGDKLKAEMELLKKGGKNSLKFTFLRNDQEMASIRSSSGGERKRFNLAFSLASSDFIEEFRGISFNVAVYDEFMERIGSHGQSSIVEILASRLESKRLESIFCISHVEDLQQLFPQSINIHCDMAGVSSVQCGDGSGK